MREPQRQQSYRRHRATQRASTKTGPESVCEKSAVKWIWPSVSDVNSARHAALQGVLAATFCAAMTAFVTAMTLWGPAGFPISLDTTAFIDAAFFAAIAFGIYRMSRVASIAGLLLYVVERVYMWTVAGPTNLVVAVVITLAFVSSIRGAFAYRRLVREISSPPRPRGITQESESASVTVRSATIDSPDIVASDQPKRRAVLVPVLSVGVLSIIVIALIGHLSKWSFLPFGMRGERESSEATTERLVNDGYRKLLQLAESRKGRHLYAEWHVNSDGTYNVDVDLYHTDKGAVLVMFWHNESVPPDGRDNLQNSARSPERKMVLRDSDHDNSPEEFKEYSESAVTQHVPFALESLVPLDGNDARAQMVVLWGFGIQLLLDTHFPYSKYTSESLSGI